MALSACSRLRSPLLRGAGAPARSALWPSSGAAPLAAPPAAAPLAARWGPQCQDSRGVATVRQHNRVRINRSGHNRAVKVGAPKTEWQMAAEREFLALRSQIPKDEYLWYLTEDDVKNLAPEMKRCLSLRLGSAEDVSRWRTHQLIRKFQRRAYDTNSPAVRIATLTEKILRLRAHLLKYPQVLGSQAHKRVMAIRLTKRTKAMKQLYKHDYELYKHVCKELGIRCVRFAIPGSKDPQKMVNPQAIDGDKAKFLIRQRMYIGKWRPLKMQDLDAKGKLIRYTRHPMERVPESHGKPKPAPQQISRAWPYGVRDERVAGKQVVYNPTAAGIGFWPAKGAVVGGPTPQ